MRRLGGSVLELPIRNPTSEFRSSVSTFGNIRSESSVGEPPGPVIFRSSRLKAPRPSFVPWKERGEEILPELAVHQKPIPELLHGKDTIRMVVSGWFHHLLRKYEFLPETERNIIASRWMIYSVFAMSSRDSSPEFEVKRWRFWPWFYYSLNGKWKMKWKHRVFFLPGFQWNIERFCGDGEISLTPFSFPCLWMEKILHVKLSTNLLLGRRIGSCLDSFLIVVDEPPECLFPRSSRKNLCGKVGLNFLEKPEVPAIWEVFCFLENLIDSSSRIVFYRKHMAETYCVAITGILDDLTNCFHPVTAVSQPELGELLLQLSL